MLQDHRSRIESRSSRNIVVHGHDTNDPAVEWKIIRDPLPSLIARTDALAAGAGLGDGRPSALA